MTYINNKTGEPVIVVKKSMSHVEFLDSENDWHSIPVTDFDLLFTHKEDSHADHKQ